MEYQAVLDFWFGPGNQLAIIRRRQSLWWGKNPEIDAAIRSRFGAVLEAMRRGGHGDWLDSPEGRLAWVITADQFSRNIFRADPRSYAMDDMALKNALEGIANGHDKALWPLQRVFLYMPLEHSESLELQQQSVGLFESLVDEAEGELVESFKGFLDYARQHRDVIEMFGRFPHRNAVLGRCSTPAEIEYLQQPGAGF